MAASMTVDASLVADLRNSWKAQDGAGIQRALARILGERAAVDEIQHGLTALAGELGFSIKLSAAGKRKREAALEAASARASSADAAFAGLDVRGVHLDADVCRAIIAGFVPPAQAHGKLSRVSRAWAALVGSAQTWEFAPLVIDSGTYRGLPCKPRSSDFEALVTLPRFMNVRELQLQIPALKPNAAACKAIGALAKLRRVDIRKMNPTGPSAEALGRAFARVEEMRLPDYSREIGTILRHASLSRVQKHISSWGSGFGAIGEAGATLTWLKIRGKAALAAVGWTSFAEGGALSDLDLATIVARCPNLKFLDISFNFKLTDATAHALGASCAKLEVLRWQHLGASVTDAGLAGGLRHATALRWLDLSALTTDRTPLDGTGRVPDATALRAAGLSTRVHLLLERAEGHEQCDQITSPEWSQGLTTW